MFYQFGSWHQKLHFCEHVIFVFMEDNLLKMGFSMDININMDEKIADQYVIFPVEYTVDSRYLKWKGPSETL